MNKATNHETSLCWISHDSKTHLSEFPGFITINSTKDILYVKKSDNQISIFCLGEQSEMQELVMRVKTRKEAMIASGYIPKTEENLVENEEKIISIIPLTSLKNGKINEKVMVVMNDGFVNVFELINGQEDEPQSEENRNYQGSGFNNTLSMSFSENVSGPLSLDHPLDRNITNLESSMKNDKRNIPDHLMLDLFSRSRAKALKERVLKAVVSPCNKFFLLSSFYIENHGPGQVTPEAQKYTKNFIWILRLYFIEETGSLKFLTKTTLKLAKSKKK